ncbi:phosphonate C-P lyase system protein PhnG [Pannonibacter tanglangensis]|uniref:Phosphonate C-P lyase system protein PhnG n=1 Tax=Pannonibacter tanglangensis TaxID=2750084 RepID=A0ABW9ZM85_9HYPH|nr:phosphonate C-P lyase system protein PhnG [Pannonibacter sp. XCT-34]NBN65990.1 phosphonate C-P lyase system protein PhnG [Pannonibacter sp. XCT-34]
MPHQAPPPSASPDESPDASTEARRRLMAALATATPDRLAAALAPFAPLPAHELVRAPETGLVMVRGRMGGTGAPFNLGEVTVTRCVVRLENGIAGSSYVMGRSKQKALHAALVDALWQSPELTEAVEREILAPLASEAEAADATVRAETAATKVDFFTMVRGDD